MSSSPIFIFPDPKMPLHHYNIPGHMRRGIAALSTGLVASESELYNGDTTPESSPGSVDKHDAIFGNPPPRVIVISDSEDKEPTLQGTVSNTNNKEVADPSQGNNSNASVSAISKDGPNSTLTPPPTKQADECPSSGAQNQLGDPKVVKGMYEFDVTPDLRNVTLHHNGLSMMQLRKIMYGSNNKDVESPLGFKEYKVTMKEQKGSSSSVVIPEKEGSPKPCLDEGAISIENNFDQRGNLILNINIGSLPFCKSVVDVNVTTCCLMCKRKHEEKEVVVDDDQRQAKTTA